MKKLLSLIAILVLIFSLTACKENVGKGCGCGSNADFSSLVIK